MSSLGVKVNHPPAEEFCLGIYPRTTHGQRPWLDYEPLEPNVLESYRFHLAYFIEGETEAP